MTDTIPAADTGLPADQHPDAKLLELRALLVASEARVASYKARLDEGSVQYDPPPIPGALLFRPSDRPHVCADPGELGRVWADGDWRPFYEDLDSLSTRATRFLDRGDAYTDDLFSLKSRARVREISTTYAVWRDAIREAEQSANVLEPGEAFDRESERIDGLVHEMGAVPASTIEGVAVKLRTALGRRHTSAPLAEEESLLVAVLADIERLGAADPSTSKRSAA